MKTAFHRKRDSTTTNATSWPINRLSYIEVSHDDMASIDKLLVGRRDTPLLIKWVVLRKSVTTFRPRLVVLSALRLWVLKHKQSFKKTLALRRVYQLMHVQEFVAMRSSTPDSSPTISIQLVYMSSKQTNEEPETLHFDPGVHTENFVRLLQRVLYALRQTFPHQHAPVVQLPRDCHWHECFSAETLPIDPQDQDETEETTTHEPEQVNPVFAAMTMAYHAFCDDLGVRLRDSVPSRLEECARTSKCMDFQYCLGFPPGVNGYDSLNYSPPPPTLLGLVRSMVDTYLPSSSRLVARYQAKEIQALAQTVASSRCFTDIIISDLAMSQPSLSILFQSLLSPRCTIQGFTFTNVQLSVRALRILQHVILESSMRQHDDPTKQLELRRLDVSFNRFTLAMATEFATILQLLTNGLELLQLEQCGLTTVSCCRILEALTTSSAFGTSLMELNLAGNHLGVQGTRSLASWLTGTVALARLDVSRTQVDINVFVQALMRNTKLHDSSLLQLDLSYNEMRTQASQDLGVILGNSHSLTSLFLRGMKRYRHYHKLLPLQLQKDGTVLKAALVAQTATAQRTGTSRHGATGLRKHFLRNIFAPMFANAHQTRACMVDLSDNDLSGHRAEVLAQLFDDSPWTTRTSLRLDHACLHDKAALLLLHSLRSCKTLESLSLEGNGLIKRDVHYKRIRQNEKCYSNGVCPSDPTEIEQAGANALAVLLGGGTWDYNDHTLQKTAAWLGTSDAGSVSASFLLVHSAERKEPLRLKEICLKCEGSYVFGAHIITAAVHALARPHAALQMLDVTGNGCGDALAQALGDVLPQNKSLQALYWDGNCITVDGYFQFYDGLSQNKTLIMVQMPIQDTRRILQEEIDPPRDKLFGILGKIFKATERNQMLTRQTKEQSVDARESSVSEQSSRLDSYSNQKHSSETPEIHVADSVDDQIKEGLETAGLTLKCCPSPKLTALHESENNNATRKETLNCKSYSKRSASTRYPSTMQSWSMQSSTDEFQSQLYKLDSFTASFSLTPSHM